MTTGEWVRSQWKVFFSQAVRCHKSERVAEWVTVKLFLPLLSRWVLVISASTLSSSGSSLCSSSMIQGSPSSSLQTWIIFAVASLISMHCWVGRALSVALLGMRSAIVFHSARVWIERRQYVFRKATGETYNCAKLNQSMRRQVFNYISYVMVCMALIEHHVVDII